LPESDFFSPRTFGHVRFEVLQIPLLRRVVNDSIRDRCRHGNDQSRTGSYVQQNTLWNGHSLKQYVMTEL
jgi:hypothetical protein